MKIIELLLIILSINIVTKIKCDDCDADDDFIVQQFPTQPTTTNVKRNEESTAKPVATSIQTNPTTANPTTRTV